MTTWTYRILNGVAGTGLHELQAAGSEGWELVGETSIGFVLKRPAAASEEFGIRPSWSRATKDLFNEVQKLAAPGQLCVAYPIGASLERAVRAYVAGGAGGEAYGATVQAALQRLFVSLQEAQRSEHDKLLEQVKALTGDRTISIRADGCGFKVTTDAGSSHGNTVMETLRTHLTFLESRGPRKPLTILDPTVTQVPPRPISLRGAKLGDVLLSRNDGEFRMTAYGTLSHRGATGQVARYTIDEFDELEGVAGPFRLVGYVCPANPAPVAAKTAVVVQEGASVTVKDVPSLIWEAGPDAVTLFVELRKLLPELVVRPALGLTSIVSKLGRSTGPTVGEALANHKELFNTGYAEHVHGPAKTPAPPPAEESVALYAGPTYPAHLNLPPCPNVPAGLRLFKATITFQGCVNEGDMPLQERVLLALSTGPYSFPVDAVTVEDVTSSERKDTTNG